MARYLLVLGSQDSLRGALEGLGPGNRDLFGPEMATSEASAIWAQKCRVQLFDSSTSTLLLSSHWSSDPS